MYKVRFLILIFLGSAPMESMDTMVVERLRALICQARCTLTIYPQNTKHACHICTYKILSADCRHTFQQSTKRVWITTQNSLQHISLLHCALLILMNVFIKDNSFFVILLVQNPSQSMTEMPKYLVTKGAPTGLSTKISQNTLLPLENRQLPQDVRLL